MKLLQKIKQLINLVRNLKQKLTHDNWFDIAFGALLACCGLWLYLNIANMDKLIIIVIPALISFLNEVINVWCGQKKIMFIDIIFRTLIGIVIYYIV